MAEAQEAKKDLKKLILFLVYIIVIIATGYFTGIYKQLTPENIKAFVQSFGIWAPIVFIIIYVLRTFVFFSASVLSIVAGLAFGPLFGTIYTVIGASLSSAVAFWLARILGRDFVNNITKGKVQLIDETISEDAFRIILFMRLVPIFPYEGINYGAGLTKMKFWPYFFATMFGIIPGSFAYNFLGGNLANIKNPMLLVAIALVLLSLMVPTIYKFYKKFKTADAQKN